MAMMAMDVFSVQEGGDQYQMVKITPPQTQDAEVKPGMGAYCFVIDVSGRCASPISRARWASAVRPAARAALTRAACGRPLRAA